MKKGVMKGLTLLGLLLMLLVFLSSGILAAPPEPGECGIVARADCDTAVEGYIVMGLSAATNSHGQFPDIDYPYVLCCAFGAGTTTCTGANTVLKLSSSTNAHAEVPSQTNYSTRVCYEDLQCVNTINPCGTGDALNYPLNVTSLSSLTNAHIGGINDYSTKICCRTGLAGACTLESAEWSTTTATEGVMVRLTVKGSGQECGDQQIKFTVYEEGGLGADTLLNSSQQPSPSTVNFNGDTATAEWKTIWHSGLVNPEYYFNASLVSTPIRSLNTQDARLTVTERTEESNCDTISACADYPNEADCESDAVLCNVADDTAPAGIECTGSTYVCGCLWDEETSTCGFVLSEIQGPECGNGYTLCTDPVSGWDYCYPGTSCPLDHNPDCNGDGVCDQEEGCTCSDCEGLQDSCAIDTTCSSGSCYSSTIPVTEPLCEFGYTLCRDSSLDYCYPGNVCPSGDNPFSNNNGSCDVGEGCTSSDCIDGDQDTCSTDTYCYTGLCYATGGAPKIEGYCKISQIVEKTCDVEPMGYKILRWTGIWSGEESGSAYERCIAGGRITVPCPAQIQLPFFDYYELGITLIIIALIYISMIFKRKFRRKKK